ncbi:MAG TPA: LuxR C-terminal-related transcriptional regulator [Anaerolineae bacterium]|nr:LuxR C-terminal-related transcriptional regulator [Anaerolineae bacterium]
MSTPILATKLYIPPTRSKVVQRPGLIEQLNTGLALGCKLTLVSAPAGFGKTTLVSAWVAGCGQPAAWLSLDEGDNDLTCFLTYLVAALQTLAPHIGAGVLAALQSPQLPSIESFLTVLLNEIATLLNNFILVLDDYHVIDSQPVDQALVFLLEHLPPQMHLVIATREDPSLPLARLRARNQLTELRAADLRFTPAEAAEFLNQVMGLNLAAEDIAALETRTEGWIAGLQLAAISMQGHRDVASFIKSFTGSHRFVLDYLIEEVLQQQPESIQTFLLRTSILERMCGPLCDAVVRDPAVSGQETLEYLEHANLFIVPLDHERHWYRYHHLFGDLLRKRLGQSLTSEDIAGLHIRASEWYEDQGLDIEAFQHAAAANDIERAERLMEGWGMPLHFRGAVNAILAWLASLPESVLDTRPLLRVRLATMALTAGQTTGVDEKIQAAEKALQNAELAPQTRDLLGQIACARATLAITQYQPETVLIQARRALEYLLPENLRFRFTANWALSVAYHLQGERAAARQALAEVLSINQTSTSMFSTILAVIHLGRLQELENQLYQAAETYRRALQMASEQPQPNTSDAHLGLARIAYEWNDLDAAEQHGQQALLLAQQFDRALDRFILCEVFLVRLKLARGDADGAAAMLAQIEQSARQQNFILRLPDIAAAQVLVLLRQGDVAAATRLAHTHDLPISQARVHLAQGDTSRALALLSPLRQQMEAKGWQDVRLRAMVLEAIALRAHGEKDKAAQLLGDALALAEPDGFIRLFVDEGEPMRLMIFDFRLLIEKQPRGQQHKLLGYVDNLLAAFAQPQSMPQSKVGALKSDLVEPLSQRELEVLRLIAEGLSNHEIGARLFLALDTVKGHNRRIFDKLQVQRRTEAIARARELGLV